MAADGDALPSDNGSGPSPVFPLSDLGNAERLVARHGVDVRFVPGMGWHAWDGRRWRIDDDGAVLRRAKLSVRSILGEAQRIEDFDKRKAATKWALTSETE